MISRSETVLSDEGLERWNRVGEFQKDVIMRAYTRSLMDGGKPVWIQTPHGATLAVVTAGHVQENT